MYVFYCYNGMHEQHSHTLQSQCSKANVPPDTSGIHARPPAVLPASKGPPQVVNDPNIAAQMAKLLEQTAKHPPNVSVQPSGPPLAASARRVKESWPVAGDVHVARLRLGDARSQRFADPGAYGVSEGRGYVRILFLAVVACLLAQGR